MHNTFLFSIYLVFSPVENSSFPSIEYFGKASVFSDSVEEKAISRVFELPEVKAMNRSIDSLTNHKRGISIMVVKKPKHGKDYYWIKAGDNDPVRYETIYNFYVYLPDLEIRYLDTMNDRVLSLKEWRKMNK